MRDFLLFLLDTHHLLFLGIGATLGYVVGRRTRTSARRSPELGLSRPLQPK